MTRKEFYKYLKQEKLFSTFCSYLATCYEIKCITSNNNLIYCYKQPKNKLDEFIKSNVERRKMPDDLGRFIKENWTWFQKPKIIYGGKKI